MGRPQITIDWEQMDKLLAIQCTLREVSSWFDCSEDTIERCCKREKGVTFAEYFAIKRHKGLISLRRKQYEVAMAGSIPMLIFLGKNYLGQSDKIETVSEDKLQFVLPEFLANDKKSETD